MRSIYLSVIPKARLNILNIANKLEKSIHANFTNDLFKACNTHILTNQNFKGKKKELN